MSYDLGVLNLQGEKKKKSRRWLGVGVGVVVVLAGFLTWYFFVRAR